MGESSRDCLTAARWRRSARSGSEGIAVLLATLVFGLVGAEIAFRVLEPVPRAQLLPLPYPNSDVARLVVGDTYIRFDTELGWTTGPGASAVDDGILYRANAAGFRAER